MSESEREGGREGGTQTGSKLSRERRRKSQGRGWIGKTESETMERYSKKKMERARQNEQMREMMRAK